VQYTVVQYSAIRKCSEMQYKTAQTVLSLCMDACGVDACAD
jgi:hypothetical protein